jgi:putative SOS response-associated peptidase YedK
MCGRFTLKTDPKAIASQFKVSSIAILEGRIADLTAPAISVGQITAELFQPNFNVAPTHQIPAIVSQNNETLLVWRQRFLFYGYRIYGQSTRPIKPHGVEVSS